ncbi:hypothetical protein A6U97_26005 [Agrobacterium tumefaciens]|nr:hypothetical protein A6U97_26005 [Agrobacterium tumefaciens]
MQLGQTDEHDAKFGFDLAHDIRQGKVWNRLCHFISLIINWIIEHWLMKSEKYYVAHKADLLCDLFCWKNLECLVQLHILFTPTFAVLVIFIIFGITVLVWSGVTFLFRRLKSVITKYKYSVLPRIDLKSLKPDAIGFHTTGGIDRYADDEPLRV